MQRRHPQTETERVAPGQPIAPEPNTAYPDTAHATPRWYGRSYDMFTWLSLLGGLWVAIAPWVLNFAETSPRLTTTNLIVGLAAAFVAMGSMTALRGVTGSELVNVVLGAWVVVTAFVLFPAPTTAGFMISQIVGGAAIAVFAVAGQLGSKATRKPHT